MTKFEEKLEILPIKNIEHPIGDTKYYKAVHVKTLIAQADEEFQELKEQNENQAESILLMLDEIKSLKSQLQQQALPVVPECVAGIIKKYKGRQSVYGVLKTIALNRKTDIYEWVFSKGNQDIFALAFITGKYQVEKPQLFYLKHIDMSKSDKFYDYFLEKRPDGVLVHGGIQKGKLPKLKCILKLTQEEIDSMQTGSYELVPVEDGE